jgi:very-short-patch-repair endonuclease
VLWFRLRDRRLRGLKFRRQLPLDKYFVDFCCEEAHLVIEIDGGQHASTKSADAARTKVLEAMGYLVLRFWNNEILGNIDGVLEVVLSTLKQHSSEPPHPDPLPTGEREKSAERDATSSLSHRERVPERSEGG